jgi:hypothetical protein
MSGHPPLIRPLESAKAEGGEAWNEWRFRFSNSFYEF